MHLLFLLLKTIKCWQMSRLQDTVKECEIYYYFFYWFAFILFYFNWSNIYSVSFKTKHMLWIYLKIFKLLYSVVVLRKNKAWTVKYPFSINDGEKGEFFKFILESGSSLEWKHFEPFTLKKKPKQPIWISWNKWSLSNDILCKLPIRVSISRCDVISQVR